MIQLKSSSQEKGNKAKPKHCVSWLFLGITLLHTGVCLSCSNPRVSPKVFTPQTSQESLPDPTSDIQLTVSKTLLQGADHTFTLYLQHTGTPPSHLGAYTLGLTLQEENGVGSSLTYLADNNTQQTATSPQKLTYFTTQTELDATNSTLAIPVTLQPGTDVKKVTITVTLTGPDNTQTSIVVWQLLTPALTQADAGEKILSDLLQKLKDETQQVGVDTQNSPKSTPLGLATNTKPKEIQALVDLLLAAKPLSTSKPTNISYF